jgi:hypothetical protein
MRYALSRADYEELFVLPSGGAAGAAQEAKDAALGREYPKSTEAAANELRTRGLDARAHIIDYLIKKGVVRGPKGEGRNRKWAPEDIDAVAEYMDTEGMYVPGTVARMFYDIDPGQDIRAEREAFRKNPDLPMDSSYFIMTIKPGAAGLGLRATVSYRRMTAKEEAEWQARMAEAKKAQRSGGHA